MSLQLVREWKFILCIGDSIGCCGYRGCRYYLRSRMGTALISLEFYALLLTIYLWATFDLLKASSGYILFIVTLSTFLGLQICVWSFNNCCLSTYCIFDCLEGFILL